MSAPGNFPGRAEPAPPPPRKAYFGPEHGWLDTPVVSRASLATGATGPLIVEEYNSTTLVRPGVRANLDRGGEYCVGVGVEGGW